MGCAGSNTVTLSDSPLENQVNASDPQEAFKSRHWSLQDFELRSVIGTGTFSCVRVVYTKEEIRGTSEQFSLPMVIKILKKSEVIRMNQVDHVKYEKEILSMCRHPCIIDLFASFQDDGHLYMLLEYVNGGELHSHLQKGALESLHARFYAAELLLPLAYLHSQRIVYRDLKPSNVLIDSRGHLKMADFGFAKVLEDKSLSFTLCGTPEYMAPEIIKKTGHSFGVDWWALGVVVFEMLSGYTPFFEEPEVAVFDKICAGKIEFPKKFDDKAKDLVEGMLIPDVEKRIGSLQGAEQIKKHKWWKGVRWNLMKERSAEAPFLPNVSGPDDISMFDRYAEKAWGESVRDDEQTQFEGFSSHSEELKNDLGEQRAAQQEAQDVLTEIMPAPVNKTPSSNSKDLPPSQRRMYRTPSMLEKQPIRTQSEAEMAWRDI